MSDLQAPVLTPKDFETEQDVRWCPGCGDYAILKMVQTVLPQLEVLRENIVIVSGIGCSSRFPYYVNTFGMHSIHGRAPAIASGLKAVNPDLSVWVVTGDGDALAIGGNHLIHALRRNFDMNILLFNNQIYGLTKGQYSPTSEQQKVTKSTPLGSLDHPFNPVALALGADGTFVARCIDRNPKHLQGILKRAHAHAGTSFIEIYQNCNIFNHGAFFAYTEKDSKPRHALYLEHDRPLTFGENHELGIRLDGMRPQVVKLEDGYSPDDLWIHNEYDICKAQVLVRFFDDPKDENALPRPFGVIYEGQRPTYEQLLNDQIEEAVKRFGKGNLDKLIAGKATWTIK